MVEYIFIAVAGIATLFFVLLLFSLFVRQPGAEVRARMEEYIVESEMATREYAPPEEDGVEERTPTDDGAGDDDFIREARGNSGGVKRLLANVGSIITPKGMAIRIAMKLAKANIPLKANEFVAIVFLATIFPALFGVLIMKSVMHAVVFAVVGYMLPNLWVAYMKRKRIDDFREQILDTLIMLANGLKAGYSLLQAMEMVSREAPPPMSDELRRVLKENSLGMNLEDALVNLNQRVENEDWDLVTTVVLIQRQIGGNLAEILDKIGFTIRQRMKIKGDIQTKTAQAKASGMLVGALPFGIAIMIYMINPAFMTRLFTFKQGAFRGWYLVIAGLIWEAIGMYIIMKIVDIEV